MFSPCANGLFVLHILGSTKGLYKGHPPFAFLTALHFFQWKGTIRTPCQNMWNLNTSLKKCCNEEPRRPYMNYWVIRSNGGKKYKGRNGLRKKPHKSGSV